MHLTPPIFFVFMYPSKCICERFSSSQVHFQGVRSQKYDPIKLLSVTISIRRGMIPFPSGSCLSKLERVKANGIKVAKIIDTYHIPAV